MHEPVEETSDGTPWHFGLDCPVSKTEPLARSRCGLQFAHFGVLRQLRPEGNSLLPIRAPL